MTKFDLHQSHCKFDGSHFDLSKEICDWLYENEIIYNISFPHGNSFIMLIANTINGNTCIELIIDDEEDAVLFKLRWL